jgi:hypothetical protein
MLAKGLIIAARQNPNKQGHARRKKHGHYYSTKDYFRQRRQKRLGYLSPVAYKKKFYGKRIAA